MQISSLGQKQEPENSKVKKYVLIALIISFVLLIVVLICMVLFSSMKTTPLTLIVDGETKPFKEDTFIFENNNIYISLEDISNLVGYKYYRGAYGGEQQYTEDTTKCYLECNDEVVTYELKQYNLYKTPKDVTNQYSEFTMSEPVKRNNNKLYVISSGLETGCNLKFMYNEKTNQLIINTLPGLYKVYNDKAEEGAYINVDSISDNFNNKKAILYDMLVVKSGNKYGVTALDGVTTRIGTKYDEMEFIENTQEFLVKANDRYGIITKDGTVKIGINYSKIELLDNANGLYYAVNASNKKGVLRNGKILGRLYVEYDEIGINPALFPANDIKNARLLYDNCIPVKKDNKWGMFDITGNMISNFYWDSFGYVYTTSNSERAYNILLIEDISGIVVCQNGKYGIMNSIGKLIVPCVFDRIYSEVAGGEKIYYIQFEGRTIDLKTYLRENGIEIDKPNDDDNPGMIDLNASPTPNLDLETPNVVQKPSPSPTPSPEPSPVDEPTPIDNIDDENHLPTA